MFTGIIEAVGRVAGTRERAGAREITIEAPSITPELPDGASVAVDGACLTVVRTEGESFTIEAIGTTLSRTVAGRYRPGSRVNLERAMALGQRLDGHLVQGHVDGVGTLAVVRREGEFWLLDFNIPGDVAAVTLLHGSICINGISLTVNALPSATLCQVAIIPYTWGHTNLSDLQPGDPVNLEGDLIGKYVQALLTRGKPGLDLERLSSLGYGASQD